MIKFFFHNRILHLILSFFQSCELPLFFLHKANGLEDHLHNTIILFDVVVVQPYVIHRHEERFYSLPPDEIEKWSSLIHNLQCSIGNHTLAILLLVVF